MTHQLSGKKVLVLVSNGVEESVMSNVQRELLKAGAIVKTVGTETGLVNSWNSVNNGWGLYFPVDQQIGQTLGSDFDVLIVPSGARGILKLSANPHAERIAASFIAAGKPMIFMGDAVELLAKTNLAQGWKVAGPAKSRDAMVAAGAEWQEEVTAVHNAMLTGDDKEVLPFIGAIFAHISASAPEMQAAA
jgi:protease I